MAADTQIRASRRPQGRLTATWDDIARVLKQRDFNWTPERLRRAVKWLVAEHLADPGLLKKSPPRLPEGRLMTLGASIHASDAARNRGTARAVA